MPAEFDAGSLAPAISDSHPVIVIANANNNAMSGAFNAVSCTSPDFCMAVGGSVNAIPLAEEWNGTDWSILPAETFPPGGVTGGLHGVSCTSSSACTAVGNYSDFIAGGPQMPFVETWNGDTWSAQNVPNPVGRPNLYSVSCASSIACTAVGYYENSNGYQGYSEIWNGSTWNLESMPSPSDSTGTMVTSVSCASANACTAVGFYLDASAGQYGLTLAEVWNGSTWSVQDTPSPAGVESFLSAVSCPAPNDCIAVGYSSPPSSGAVGLAEVWNGSAWSIESVPSPSGATGNLPFAVSCFSAAACTLTGYYTDSSGEGFALAEGWDGSTWSVQSTLNRGGFSGVWCASSIFCVAVGAYTKHKSGDLTLAEAWNGSAWSILTPAVLSLAVEPTSGTPKQSVTLSGGGFTGNTSVVVTYQTGVRKTPNVTLCSPVTDSSGAFTCTAAIPGGKTAGAKGLHYVEAQEPGLGWITAKFTLT